MADERLEFCDPKTGEHYFVAPMFATVNAAWKLGLVPWTGRDVERTDIILNDGHG